MRVLSCCAVPLVLVCAHGVLVFASESLRASQQSKSSFPPLLDTYLTTHVHLTPAEQKSLLSSVPVTKLLEADPNKEVSVFGAVWIDAAPADYVRLIEDIERFEHGGRFRITKKISAPPRIDDFALLRLPEEDLKALKTCRVGDCALKLGEQALERIRTAIDWKKPTAATQVEELIRKLVFEYVSGYVSGGNDRLAVYRDSDRPTFVATEFKSMIDRMPELDQHLTELKAYLLGYPGQILPDATSFLYWQEVEFGLKPTIRVNHVVINNRPDGTAIASKMIYASHYFWTALDLRVLMPDPARGRGFWFVNVSRSRLDGLSGFVGQRIRSRVQSDVQKALATSLKTTKDRLEQGK
jgi:hypothetical protein